MSLTAHEELSFRLISKCHFYMWPLPLKWDSTISKLVKIKPAYKWIPYILEVLYICVFGWISIGIPIWATYIRSQKRLKIVNLLLFITCWIMGCGIPFGIYTIFTNADASISMFNETLELTDDISKEFPDRTWRSLKAKLTTGDRVTFLFNFVVIPFLVCVPYFMARGGLISDLDIPNFFFKEILGDQMYRDGSIIWSFLAIRFFLNLLYTLGVTRNLLFCLFCFLIIIRKTSSMANGLLTRCKEYKVFFIYYIQLCLLFKKIENVLYIFVYMAMSFIFWGFVITCWVCVRCDSEEISRVGYGCFVIGMIIALIGQATIPPMCCQITDLSELLLKVHTLRAEVNFSKKSTIQNLTNLKRIRAIVPYRLKYGPFWYIRKDFLPEWFENLVLRVFDAILLHI